VGLNRWGRGRSGQRGVAARPAITAVLGGIMVCRWPAPDPGAAGQLAHVADNETRDGAAQRQDAQGDVLGAGDAHVAAAEDLVEEGGEAPSGLAKVLTSQGCWCWHGSLS